MKKGERRTLGDICYTSGSCTVSEAHYGGRE